MGASSIGARSSKIRWLADAGYIREVSETALPSGGYLQSTLYERRCYSFPGIQARHEAYKLVGAPLLFCGMVDIYVHTCVCKSKEESAQQFVVGLGTNRVHLRILLSRMDNTCSWRIRHA